MNSRVLWRVIALTGLLLVPACGEDGPSGPGTLDVAVSWDVPLGAATVQLAGTGIEGVSIGGGDWIASTPTPSGIRVVAVSRTGGEIRFQVSVSDLAAPLPVATVLGASTADDRTLPSANGINAVVSR